MKNGYKRKSILKITILSLLLLLSGMLFFVSNNNKALADTIYQVPTISGVYGYSGEFDNLSHNISVDLKYFNGTTSDNYTYQWYKDDVTEDCKIEGAIKNFFKVKNVKDSGNYYCKVTFTTTDGGSSVFSSAVKVNITPKALVDENLVLDNYEITYDQKNHTPSLQIVPSYNFDLNTEDYQIKYIYENKDAVSSLLDFNNQVQMVDAGSYYIRLVATQTGNYSGFAEQLFKINPVELTPVEMNYYNTITKEYDGTTSVKTEIEYNNHFYLSGVLTNDSVIPVVDFSEYNSSLVNSANQVSVKLSLVGQDNINYVVKENLILNNVRIAKRGLWVKWGNINLTYNGEEQIPNVSFYEGAEKYGNIDLYYTKKYAEAGNYKAEVYLNNPNIVILNPSQEFTINPYKINVKWKNFNLTYNNDYQIPDIERVCDLNGNELTYTLTGEQKIVGTHIATINFHNKNYDATVLTKTKEYFINPYELELVWLDDSFVFNNKIQYPSYSILNPLDESVKIQVVGGGRYVGYYSCQAVVNNVNYVVKNSIHQFSINERILTNEEVRVSGEIFADYLLNISENLNEIKSPLKKYEVVNCYNIEIVKDNKKQDETGYLFTVDIKINERILKKNIKVFHVLDSGETEELRVSINKENKTLSFKVGSFSEFIICVPEEESVALIVICSIITVMIIGMFLFWLMKKFKVYFVTNGGGNAEVLNVRCLESFGLPNNLKRRGYVFEGWYLEPEMITRYEKNYFRLKNITLYANWQENKSAILEELEKDINRNSKLQDLIISKRNIKIFISFGDLLEKLVDIEGNRKKVVYKIIPIEKGYNIINSELKEVVAWCKNFTDAKFLGKILALEDNTKLIILNKSGKEIKKIELNKIKHEMCLYKKFYNVYESKKQNKYNIYNINGEWFIKKNNESDSCAFAKNKKDIIRIGAIYSLIEKSKLIIYSNNGKIKKELKVVYK